MSLTAGARVPPAARRRSPASIKEWATVTALAAGAVGFAGGRFTGAARADDAATPDPPRAAEAVTWSPRLLLQTDAVLIHHGPAAPAIEDAAVRPGFTLRRTRIGTDAAAGIWRARLMIEAESQPEIPMSIAPGGSASAPAAAAGADPIAGEISAGRVRATQAFVALRPHSAFVLTAGSMRVPIGLSRQIDEGDLRLPERARVVVRATPDFRVGLAAGGDLGLLQYALGTYSAAPSFGTTFATGGALHVLRLSAEPVGPVGVTPQLRRRDDPWYVWWRFAVGLSGFYAQLPGADEFGVGGDGQFQWQRFCATGELLWTRRAGADRIGFTVEPGVFVLPEHLEMVARVEWLNDEVGPRSPADAWGAALGATLFSSGRQARLQAAYTVRRPSASAAGAGSWPGWIVLRATFTL